MVIMSKLYEFQLLKCEWITCLVLRRTSAECKKFTSNDIDEVITSIHRESVEACDDQMAISHGLESLYQVHRSREERTCNHYSSL